MGLFRDTIRDARRTLRPSGRQIQRLADEAAPETVVPEAPSQTLSPAPPIEEQPDGALTVYRFQKEGRLAPREVPNRVETGPRQSRHADPSLNVERSSESEERVTQPIDNAFVLDDSSVIASRRNNGLATGKGDTAHAKRQDSTVNEASSIGLHGKQQQVSDDLNSVESPPGQNDPVDTFSSDNLLRETGERELSRDTGLGTPSESFTIRWAAADDGRFGQGGEIASPAHPFAAPDSSGPLAGTEERDSPRVSEQTARHSPEAAFNRLSLGEQAGDPVSVQPQSRDRRESAEPRVSIGQVDVVVVSSTTPPAKTPASESASRNTASRRYWRRL